MNEELARLAREAGIVGVEHRVETTYSDDRAPYTFAVSHNITLADECPDCRKVRLNMETLATKLPGDAS